MTAYYTPTGNPASLSRGVSTLPRAEFALIAAGFTTAQADIAAKADALTAATQVTVGRNLANSDNGKVINCTSASLQTFTLVSGLTAGFHCAIVQAGAGQVQVAASVATVLNVDGHYRSSGQGAALVIINNNTDAYVLSGSTSA